MEGKRVEDDTSVMRTREGKDSESKSEGKVHEKSCSKRVQVVKKKMRGYLNFEQGEEKARKICKERK